LASPDQPSSAAAPISGKANYIALFFLIALVLGITTYSDEDQEKL
jgi:hypothetical protein